MAETHAPTASIRGSNHALMQLLNDPAKAFHVVSKQDTLAYRNTEANIADIANMMTFFYPAIYDIDTATAWDGDDGGVTVTRRAHMGLSEFTVTGLPVAWARIDSYVGSYVTGGLTLEYVITNTDSQTHNFKFALVGLAVGRAAAGDFSYDGATETANFSAKLSVSAHTYESMRLLNRTPGSYTVGAAAMDFSTGALDNTATFTPVDDASYYNGLATGSIAIAAGASVKITFVVGMWGASTAAAKAIATGTAVTHTAQEIRNQWMVTAEGFLDRPSGLTTAAQIRAWILSWYTCKVNERPGQTNLFNSSATHFREIWYWDIVTVAPAMSLDAGSTKDRLIIEHLLDTKMNQSTGFIPHVGSSTYSQPATVARAAWYYYQKSGNSVWLNTYYPKLKLHYEWWAANRMHPTLNLFYYFNGEESGQDNSPIYDTTIPVATAGATAVLYDYAVKMAEFAAIVEVGDVAFWQGEVASILADAQTMWSEAGGWFYPLSSGTTQRQIKTADAFFAIYCGLASSAQVDAMAAVISAEFIGDYGTRTTSNLEAKYQAHLYWRGPDWQVTTCLLADGLYRYGKTALARQILDIEVANMTAYGCNLEAVNTDTGEPAENIGDKVAAPFIGMNAGALLKAMDTVYQ